MRFLRNFITADENEEEEAPSEEEAKKLLSEGKQTRKQGRQLLEEVSDAKFLEDLWSNYLGKEDKEEFDNYYFRGDIVRRITEVAPDDLDFYTEVAIKEPEEYAWTPAFEQIKKSEDDKQKKKCFEKIVKSSSNEEAIDQAKFELASPDDLQEMALNSKVDKGLREKAIKNIDDQSWLKKFYEKMRNAKPPKGDDDWWKTQNIINNLVEEAVKKITDESYLKKIVSDYLAKGEGDSYGRRDAPARVALENIKDQKFLADFANKSTDAHMIGIAVKNIEDVKVLKALYEKFGENQKGKKGYSNEQWTNLRKELVKRLGKVDESFLLDRIMKEKKLSLRLEAVNQIEDEEVLKKLLKAPRLSVDVKTAAAAKIKDLPYLRELALQGVDESLARVAILRLLSTKANGDQHETVLKYMEKHKDSPFERDYQLASYFSVDDDGDFLDKALQSKDFPANYKRVLIKEVMGEKKLKPLKDFIKKDVNPELNDEALQTILNSYRGEEIKTDMKTDLEFYKKQFERAKSSYVLEQMAKGLPAKFLLDQIEKRKDLHKEVKKAIYKNMTVDKDALDFMLKNEDNNEVLYDAFKNLDKDLDEKTVFSYIEKFPPGLTMNRYGDEDADYRQPLLKGIEDPNLLINLLAEDKSPGLKRAALKRLYRDHRVEMQDEKNVKKLVKIFEESDNEKLQAELLSIIPKESYKPEWGAPLAKHLLYNSYGRMSSTDLSNRFLVDLAEHCDENLKAEIFKKLNNESDEDKAVLKELFGKEKSAEARLSLLNNIDDKEFWREAGLKDEDEKIRVHAVRELLDNPEIMLETYQKDPSEKVKEEAVLFISPNDMKPEMVKDFISGLHHTTLPNRVKLDLKVQAYKVSKNKKERIKLAEMLPNRLLDKEHAKPEGATPQFEENDERRGKKVGEASQPKMQLLKLLLTYAKPPAKAQASVSFREILSSRYLYGR